MILVTCATGKAPALLAALSAGTQHPAVIYTVVTAVKSAFLLPVLAAVSGLYCQDVQHPTHGIGPIK